MTCRTVRLYDRPAAYVLPHVTEEQIEAMCGRDFYAVLTVDGPVLYPMPEPIERREPTLRERYIARLADKLMRMDHD